MMLGSVVLALVWLLCAAVQIHADCALSCAQGATCYATAEDAMACISSLPFNQEWALATLDVLSQSLENFGFAALYHNTGPPYSLSIDIQQELSATRDMVNSLSFASDLEFQEHVQQLLQATLDAHTRYRKPACYNAVFLQPFAFDLRVISASEPTAIANEPSLFIMRNLYTDLYSSIYPDISDVHSIIDKEVKLLNGVEFTSEIASWGDTHETRSNNAGARFNAALRSYLYRSAMTYNVVPLSDLTITFADGSEVTLPWMASYTTGLGDVNTCAASSSSSSAAIAQSPGKGLIHDQSYPKLIESPAPLHAPALYDSRLDREVIVPTTAPYPLYCFVQTIEGQDAGKAGVKRVLVMKVTSFSPSGFYLDAWSGFLAQAEQCLSTKYDMIVVDVIQNGGGYVCLGLRLIELLVEDYFNDHTLVQMNYDLPHSSLMDRYIDVVNAPNPYPYPQDVEQILNKSTQQAFPDGRAYYYPGRNVTQGGVTSWRTNFFSLNCTQAEAMPSLSFRPSRFVTPDKLIILSDGTCGSTCASFTKIPQEAGKATFVGVGGLWDEPMDVASFAGGFVCNPDYLANIAQWANTTFPKFLTDQSWQFGWATWYSAKLPSRAIQFTVQDPDSRQAFWGFPHVSINATLTTAMLSSLYDQVIASTVNSLDTASSVDSCDDEDEEKAVLLGLLVTVSVLLALALAALSYVYFFVLSSKWYAPVVTGDEEGRSNSLHQVLVP